MGTHPIFESDFDCLTEMIIDRSKDFESILGNLRRENNELSKNILENRKISAYRRSMMGVAERISSIRAKVRNVSLDQCDRFLTECSHSLKEISDMSFIDMPANKNESWVKHRNDIQAEMERIIKSCMATIKKKQSKQKRKRIIAKPIVNTEYESSKTSGISSEEAAAFQSESLVMKQRFDEVHLIETQVADIAHITQQINENIESQAEIADEIHQNVTQTNENVRDGNEQILQATRSQSDFRMFSMIFLLGCSLTLLLLDAYK